MILSVIIDISFNKSLSTLLKVPLIGIKASLFLYINDTTGILGIEKEVFYKMPVLLLNYIHPDDKKLFVDHFISSVYNNKMIEYLGGRSGIDRISGFIYIGHKAEEPLERKRPDPKKVISHL